jgi:hypothetical protein
MQRRSEQLESEAERTRAQLADSIEELRTRMSPSRLVHRLANLAPAGGGEAVRSVGSRVKENPLPAALLAGLAFVLIKRIFPAQLGSAASLKKVSGELRRAAENASGRLDELADERARATTAASRGSLLRFARNAPILSASLGLLTSAAIAALIRSGETERSGEVEDLAQKAEGVRAEREAAFAEWIESAGGARAGSGSSSRDRRAWR